MEHRVIDEGRVHHDVAVVGHEQVRRTRLQALQSGEADAIGGALHGAVDIRLDARLQGIHRIDAGRLLAQAIGNERLEQPAKWSGQAREAKAGEGAEKGVVAQQACQHGRDFVVGVGSDGIEFAHHVLVVRLLGVPIAGHK
jgi:hypothetical protein